MNISRACSDANATKVFVVDVPTGETTFVAEGSCPTGSTTTRSSLSASPRSIPPRALGRPWAASPSSPSRRRGQGPAPHAQPELAVAPGFDPII